MNSELAAALNDYAKANQAIEHAKHFGRHGDGADVKAKAAARAARSRILVLVSAK